MANLIQVARDATLSHVPNWGGTEMKPVKRRGVLTPWRVTIRGENSRVKMDWLGEVDFYPLTNEHVHQAETVPRVIVESRAKGVYWLYQKEVYRSPDRALTPSDVVALINEQANRRRLALEKAHALQAMTEQLDKRGRREHIPQDAKVLVWQRDGGRCTECGSQKELEFDHVIPLAMGGSNTSRNLQLLCAVCNRRKGATLG